MPDTVDHQAALEEITAELDCVNAAWLAARARQVQLSLLALAHTIRDAHPAATGVHLAESDQDAGCDVIGAVAGDGTHITLDEELALELWNQNYAGHLHTVGWTEWTVFADRGRNGTYVLDIDAVLAHGGDADAYVTRLREAAQADTPD